MINYEKNIENIFVKNFFGSFKISDEIFDVLKTFDQDLILWRKNDQEVILFSKETWGIFVKEIQKNKGFTDSQLLYTKDGRNFIRKLYSFVQPVSLRKRNIFLNGKNSLKNFLKGRDFLVLLNI